MSETIVGVFGQVFLPISHMRSNTLYCSSSSLFHQYPILTFLLQVSGTAPRRQIDGALPHITIMMPVYKESLEEVLAPTIESVSRAISTYELQGGTASIIVCEDGMQLVDAAEQEKRKDYYNRTNCAWVARPKENRAGRYVSSIPSFFLFFLLH
jgi:hypothetical protein